MEIQWLMNFGNFARQFLRICKRPLPDASGPQLLEFADRLSPSFVLIGAQRCGTTSLYSYLSEHPNVVAAARKEIHYFDIFFDQGLAWYASQFPEKKNLPPNSLREPVITGEASPYYLFHPLSAERLAAVFPQVKLLIILRNPIDRALSHYQHEVRLGNETLPFEAALAAEDDRLKGLREQLMTNPLSHSQAFQSHSYRSRGQYMEQIEVWLQHFPREQMHIVISEDFYADPDQKLRATTDFLGLAPLPSRNQDTFKKHNFAEYSKMDPGVRADLINFFRPHNQRLEEFLGRSLGWDS